MKILLQSKEIIARRAKWTDAALRKFVEPEARQYSAFSRSGKGIQIYDMQKVLEAEKKPEFIAYQAKRKESENV